MTSAVFFSAKLLAKEISYILHHIGKIITFRFFTRRTDRTLLIGLNHAMQDGREEYIQ